MFIVQANRNAEVELVRRRRTYPSSITLQGMSHVTTYSASSSPVYLTETARSRVCPQPPTLSHTMIVSSNVRAQCRYPTCITLCLMPTSYRARNPSQPKCFLCRDRGAGSHRRSRDQSATRFLRARPTLLAKPCAPCIEKSRPSERRDVS